MKVHFSLIEIKHILISALVLSVAFALALSDGIFNLSISRLPILVLFSFVAVGVGFLAHELIGHKIVAQRFGLYAEYRMWNFGLVIALLSSLAGFVFAAPGAVYISQKMDLWGKPTPVSRKRMGIVGLMGPAINVIISVLFLAFSLVFNHELFSMGASINIWLAIFNMLPVPPLDGSKVFAWDKKTWAGFFAACVALFVLLMYF